MEKKIELIVEWLQKQVKLTGVKGLVVGVSGGLDSAVVAHLIKRACPDQSMGVIMPLKSSEQDIVDANEVIKTCGIDALTIDLTNTFDLMYPTIQSEIKDRNEFVTSNDRLANANLRARLRMRTLYTVATNYNYLVVGTDNKSEWFTGYFTKYGDGGVDILPIVDFTKHEVVEMARILGVPEQVIEKAPSADLWEGQTDEEEMGTTYGQIDAYLNGEEIPEKDQKLIENMHRRTEHKRLPVTQFKLQ